MTPSRSRVWGLAAGERMPYRVGLPARIMGVGVLFWTDILVHPDRSFRAGICGRGRRGGRRTRDFLLELLGGRNDLHRPALGENRQIAQDHLFRAADRRPGIRAIGRRWKLVIGDFDPLAVTDAGLDLRPYGLAVLVLPAVSLLAGMRERGQGQRRTPGRSMITLA